jgi:hypothetical protein
MSGRAAKWLGALALAVAVAGPAAFLAAQYLRAGRGADGAYCKSNLCDIQAACLAYAADNGGELPDSLERLYPDYVVSEKVFSCPLAPSDCEDFVAGAVSEKSSSYALEPGLRADMPGDFIVAYEKSVTNHGGRGFNAVALGGGVEWWDGSALARFQSQLAGQRRLLEDCRKRGAPLPVDPAKLKPVELQKGKRR